MVQPPTKSSLSLARQRLIALMQQINFGRIEGLVIRAGEPVLNDPAPRIFHEFKLAAENGPRPERAIVDFALRAQLVDLFVHFDRLRDARIEVLIIKHGLPFTMHVEAAA